MDYLQYTMVCRSNWFGCSCFKPYYKWITFNTAEVDRLNKIEFDLVLNLIINGLPSILAITNFQDGLMIMF